MDRDEIGRCGHLAVAQPELPDIGISDRHFHPRLDRADRRGQVNARHLPAQQHFIANHDRQNRLRELAGQPHRVVDLLTVLVRIARQPKSLENLEAMAFGYSGDLVEPVIG